MKPTGLNLEELSINQECTCLVDCVRMMLFLCSSRCSMFLSEIRDIMFGYVVKTYHQILRFSFPCLDCRRYCSEGICMFVAITADILQALNSQQWLFTKWLFADD